jgi:hypothetical protein
MRRVLVGGAVVLTVVLLAAPAHARVVATVAPGWTLTAGPVFTGSAVAWGEADRAGDVRIRRAAGGRVTTVYSARVPAPPASGFSVTQGLDTLAGSASLLAMVRAGDASPGCVGTRCTRAAPRPWFSELRIGRPNGPLHRTAHAGTPTGLRQCPRSGTWPRAVDVWSTTLAYVLGPPPGCASILHPTTSGRVVVVRPGRPPILVARLRNGSTDAVAVAGRYVAWKQWRVNATTGAQEQIRVVVFDLVRKRIAYSVSAAALRSDGALAFDVQTDGLLALVATPRNGACAARVAWASPSHPRPRFLHATASDLAVHVSGSRLLFVRRVTPPCSSSSQANALDELVAAGLGGRTTVVAGFSHAASTDRVGGGDLSGRRVVYARATGPADPSTGQMPTSISETRLTP